MSASTGAGARFLSGACRGPPRIRPRAVSWIRLAGRAPVGGAVVVPLPARADRRAAARTGPPRAPVDRSLRPAAVERRPHQPCRLGEDTLEVPLRDCAQALPRRDPRAPEGLGAPDVSDPGHQPLAEGRLAKHAPLAGSP